MKATLIPATIFALFAAAAAAAPVAGEQDLSALINRELRSGGSWFTADEQKVIAAKCGYRPGEWDGFEAMLSDGNFHCTNGRVVDDPEMRALIRAAEPRIEARVERVMNRADVRAAISSVARKAAAEAVHEMKARRGG